MARKLGHPGLHHFSGGGAGGQRGTILVILQILPPPPSLDSVFLYNSHSSYKLLGFQTFDPQQHRAS